MTLMEWLPESAFKPAAIASQEEREWRHACGGLKPDPITGGEPIEAKMARRFPNGIEPAPVVTAVLKSLDALDEVSGNAPAGECAYCDARRRKQRERVRAYRSKRDAR